MEELLCIDGAVYEGTSDGSPRPGVYKSSGIEHSVRCFCWQGYTVYALQRAYVWHCDGEWKDITFVKDQGSGVSFE